MNQEDAIRLQTMRSELNALKQRLAALEAEHSRCDARIRELHDQNTNLVQLTVASELLANSVEREDVLGAIEEIIVNMVGSEELAVFDLDDDGASLRIARLRGVEAASPRLVGALGLIRSVLKTGQAYVVRERAARGVERAGGLTAAVPLLVERKAVGVVALFRLVQQKSELDANDHDLFEVLSRQAALALHSRAYRSLRQTVRPPISSAQSRKR